MTCSSTPLAHEIETAWDYETCSRIPLRIGFLMDHPSPHMTGLLEAVAARKDCTLEVLYCDRRAPQRNWGSANGQVPHAFLRGFTGPMGFRFNPGIFQAISRLRVDVWVVNTVYSSLSTWMAVWWLQRYRKIWVYMNEPVRPRRGLHSFVKELPLGYVLNRAHGVISTGRAAIEKYRRRLRPGLPAASVPYYIDLSAFSRLQPVFPSQNQDVEFVNSGRMIQSKALDCLRRACETLPAAGWHLTLVGDGPLRMKLEEEFAPLVQRGRVRFAGEFPYQSRAEAFAGRHVFVFPSLWDGWGMVVPEALAAGLPVLSSNQVTSAHEFIRNGENGFIVPAGDPESLADRMRWFLDHKSECERMSRAARQSLESYNSDSGASNLVSYLRGISDKNAGVPARSLQPETYRWSLLTTSQNRFGNLGQSIRGSAKDVVLRSSLMSRPHRKPRGHLIVGYHLVLEEDRLNFEDHLKFFRDHFRICSVPDLVRAAVSGDETEFRLALTFDDGFRPLMKHCLESLGKYEIKAGFFIPAAFVSAGLTKSGRADEFSRKAFFYRQPLAPMSPEDLKTLVEMGHEIGSHGLFHASIHSMTPEFARKELMTSRSMISDWTGIPPAGFCYPYGISESSLGNPADWIREAGYAYGLTLTRGSVDQQTNRFTLPRHHVEGNWPVRHLRYFLLN